MVRYVQSNWMNGKYQHGQLAGNYLTIYLVIGHAWSFVKSKTHVKYISEVRGKRHPAGVPGKRRKALLTWEKKNLKVFYHWVKGCHCVYVRSFFHCKSVLGMRKGPRIGWRNTTCTRCHKKYSTYCLWIPLQSPEEELSTNDKSGRRDIKYHFNNSLVCGLAKLCNVCRTAIEQSYSSGRFSGGKEQDSMIKKVRINS